MNDHKELTRIGREITYKYFGNDIAIGRYFLYSKTGDAKTRGVPIKITNGQFIGEYGLSNFWYWKHVLPDGRLGAEENGYGGKSEVFYHITKQQAIDKANQLQRRRKIIMSMEIMIHEQNKQVAENLIDVTSLEIINRYLISPESDINLIVVVQEGYNLAEVVSAMMVSNSDYDKRVEHFPNSAEYYMNLLKEDVVRIIGAPGLVFKEEMMDKMDPIEKYELDEAVDCIMLPPMYWIQFKGKKWR